MRRSRGFTLVELLVSLFALALLAGLSWRGLDGMMRARDQTQLRADEILTLQIGLAQWGADLDAITALPPSPSLEWNGRVLRLTRRSSLAPADGARVVAWTQRQGQWLRWESQPLQTRSELEGAWLDADLWSRNPSDAMRRQEVAIGPLEDWQIFYFRENAWSNPLSTSAGGTPATATAAPATASGGLPDGLRLVLQLPTGRAISGRLQRDWMRPTLTP
jgi:general secretion pathway protein J